MPHDCSENALLHQLNTALHYGRVGTIDVLVDAGATVESRDQDGRTPLHDDADQLHQGAMLALLKPGADVNAKTNRGDTPLHNAACNAGMQGTAHVVDVLLRWGAGESMVDEDGETPADVVGYFVEEQDRLPEDVEKVRKLVTNAPADRAWRRRGYVIMCRAHPNKLQLKHIAQPDAGVRPKRLKTRSRAKVLRAEETAI